MYLLIWVDILDLQSEESMTIIYATIREDFIFSFLNFKKRLKKDIFFVNIKANFMSDIMSP